MRTQVTLPLTKEQAARLVAGQAVSLSGVLYTARDAAHKKLCALIREGAELPFPLEGAVIYYTGPCPAPPGRVIGSCGPTTSYRMDAYAPLLYEKGVMGAVGKGRIGEEVIRAMAERGGVYFLAAGGAGALLAGCVVSSEVVAFPELGAEAIRRLVVKDLPVLVGIDAQGRSILL